MKINLKPFLAVALMAIIGFSCEKSDLTTVNNDANQWSIYDFEKIKNITSDLDRINLYENDKMEYISIPEDINLDELRNMTYSIHSHLDDHNVFLYYYAKERLFAKTGYAGNLNIEDIDGEKLNIDNRLLKHLLSSEQSKTLKASQSPIIPRNPSEFNTLLDEIRTGAYSLKASGYTPYQIQLYTYSKETIADVFMYLFQEEPGLIFDIDIKRLFSFLYLEKQTGWTKYIQYHVYDISGRNLIIFQIHDPIFGNYLNYISTTAIVWGNIWHWRNYRNDPVIVINTVY